MLYHVSMSINQAKGVHMAGIIGENLRRLRLAAGMSQAQLGEAMGFPQSTISYWENTYTWSPEADTMRQLCALFQVEPNNFYQSQSTRIEGEQTE